MTAAMLIAPCGMNCGICAAYLREKNPCTGCRGTDEDKPITRTRCKIKTCEVFHNGNAKYCFECKEYPCGNLQHLDKRYRTRYGMSMIENLGTIKNVGIRKFIKSEKAKWTCAQCGGTICVHNGRCACSGKKN